MMIKSQTKAFSIVELMVVVSIISLLTALSISPMNRLHIKVARAEMAQNMNILRSLGKSMQVDNEGVAVTPTVLGWFNNGAAPTSPYNCNGSMSWGQVFSDTDCLKIRYLYQPNINPNGTITITALAMRGGMINYGNNAIMNLAFCTNGYYYDAWTMTADMAPALSGPLSDITLYCR